MRTNLEARKDRCAFVRRGVAVICLLLGGAAAASAQAVGTELLNPQSATDDQFGSALAVSSDGGTVLVGAPEGAIGGLVGAGRVDVYSRQGGLWTATAELSVPAAQVPTASDLFGLAVALSADGTVAIVGAPNRHGSGAFETFELQGGTWTWMSEVVGTASSSSTASSLGLSGDGLTAVVAAPFETSNSYSGAVYVYTRSPSGPWSQSAKLTIPPGNDPTLGWTVALSGDGATLIASSIDALCPDGVQFQCGVAYVFVRSGSAWTQQARLTASNATGGQFFGLTLALSQDGSTAAIGTYIGWGAYVFERNGSVWTESKIFDPGVGGQSVAVSGDGRSVLVGAQITPCCGAADLFTRTPAGWVKRLQITDPTAQPGGFGKPVALSADGTVAAVTAPFALRPGIGNFGKSYAFSIPASVIEAPTLSGAGLAALAVLLAAAGAFVLRRRALTS